MKKEITLYLLSCFLILSFLSAQGQSREIDSLREVIEISVDSVKIKAQIKLAEKTRHSDPSFSDSLLIAIIEYTKQIENYSGEVNAYTTYAISFAIKSNYPEAISFFNKALETAKTHQLNDKIGSSLNNLGVVYKRIGDYPRSLEYYKEALIINNKNDNIKGISANYSNLGILSDLMKDPLSAKNYYLKSLQFSQILDEENLEVAGTYMNIGILFLGEKEYDSCLYYFKKGNQSYKKEGNLRSSGYINSLNNLGHLYLETNDLQLAEEKLHEALKIVKELNIKNTHTSILFNLANLSEKRGDINTAIKYALESEEMALQSNEKNGIRDSKNLLSRLYESIGQYDRALEVKKMAMLYNDSIINEQKIRDYENKKVQLEVYEKDRKIAFQSLELGLLENNLLLEKQLKWGLFIIVSLLGLTSILIFQKYTNRKKINKNLEVKNQLISDQKNEIERINKELEKRMLRAQLNPHFIFNALNSIQHFITSDNKPFALKYLSKFSSLLRQVLESSVNLKLVLKEDIKMLNIYIDLEALRFDDAFEYDIIVDENIDQYNFEMPAMILQPFVENAIVHGLMNKGGKKKLEVRFTDQEGFILCCVIDNGIGRKKASELSSSKPSGQKSRGLEVIEKRLLSYSDSKVDNFIFIEDLVNNDGQATGTRVCIKIPK